METLSFAFVGFVVLLGIIFFYILARILYKKAGPDEALIVYGRRKLFGDKVRDEKGGTEGFRIVRGGGTFVFPAWEQHKLLSLRMMTLDIDLQHVYTSQGIPINVKAVAQVKVRGDIEHIRKAAEGFLGVPPEQVRSTIQETVAGHLRGIIGTLTLEELYKDQKRFQEKVRDEAHFDLEGMGFEFKSFVFQAIQDSEGYLDSLGQPKIQEALKNARIATALSDREAKVEEESARQQKEQKRFAVDTEIADAEKSLSLKKASIQKEVDVAKAQAVKAGEMEMKVQDITIGEREVERRKLELNATIREQADAKKYEAERLADADQYRIERQAAAERKRREEAAQAVKAEGLAKAEAESVMRREIGLAEAEAVRAKGEAEAAARRLLAEALKLYNDAGLSIEALKVLPEIAAAISEPLSRAGATTIISNGNGHDGTGAAKLSQDVVQVLSQLSPIMEQLAGVNLKSFLQDVSKIPAAATQSLVRTEPQPPAAPPRTPGS
ncbi:MAG TPA: SPFH domain-containing protein [Thermoanaerobaculia bacterium]|nr:SPFH domain-containing protein [Thermoanaerobaculia bacterium]